MKLVNWKGPERVIPNYGKATEGNTIILPDNKADSFVKQGLAVYTNLVDEDESTHDDETLKEENNDG